MKTLIQAELPESLASEAQAFVKSGGAADMNELVAEALRRYLDTHCADLAESQIREDIAWGLHGRE